MRGLPVAQGPPWAEGGEDTRGVWRGRGLGAASPPSSPTQDLVPLCGFCAFVLGIHTGAQLSLGGGAQPWGASWERPGAGADGPRLASQGPELHGRSGRAEVCGPAGVPMALSSVGPRARETRRDLSSWLPDHSRFWGSPRPRPPLGTLESGCSCWTPRLASCFCTFDEGRNRSRVFRGETSKPLAPL